MHCYTPNVFLVYIVDSFACIIQDKNTVNLPGFFFPFPKSENYKVAFHCSAVFQVLLCRKSTLEYC